MNVLAEALARTLALIAFTGLLSCDAVAQTEQRDAQAFTDVREGGLFAHLYLPSGTAPFPTVIAVGGSEGGFITGDAFGKMLSKEGIAVLGVAYFGIDGLPSTIDRIPIEYFVRAVDYAQRQPALDPRRIGIVGGSKGGELVLVLASLEPRIRSICAIVPSHVVWQSARLADTPSSSWTWHGGPLPFVAYQGPLMPASGRIADLFELSLQSERTAAAVIPVEKMGGPVLLISATRDEIWPSTAMSEAIVARLAAQSYPHAVRHLRYETGHGFSRELAPQVNAEIIGFFRQTLLPGAHGADSTN